MPPSLPFVSAFPPLVPPLGLSFCLLCTRSSPPSPQTSSAPRPASYARTGSTRVICPPAHNMRSATRGTAGRNKHHFRVPVIGRVRAPATPWRTASSAASRIITGRSHARLHPSSPHPHRDGAGDYSPSPPSQRAFIESCLRLALERERPIVKLYWATGSLARGLNTSEAACENLAHALLG